MRNLNISIGKSRKTKQWKNIQLPFKEFIGTYMKFKELDINIDEYSKMAKAKKDIVKDVGGFVGGKLKDGKRLKKNVEYRSMVTLDIDHGHEELIEHIKKCFPGHTILLYSTASHTKENIRFRFVMPLKEDITATEYNVLTRAIMMIVGDKYFDKTSVQAERLMYFPTALKDTDKIFDLTEGTYLNGRALIKKYIHELPIPQRPDKELQIKRAEEKTGPIGAFCRCFPISRVIDEYLPDIYHGSESRYTYMQGSGHNGVIVYDNDTLLFSHHSTDPANDGHCQNSFDILRIHKFKEDFDKTINFISKIQEVKFNIIEVEEMPVYKDMIDKANDKNTNKDKIIKRELEYDKHGLINTINNFMVTIGALYDIRFNELTGCVEINGKQYLKQIESTIFNEIETKFHIYSAEKMRNAIDALAWENRFHPVRDYLESRKGKFNGKSQVETIFTYYFGTPDSKYVRAVARKMLVAMAKRAMEPGCEARFMVVLNGPQEIGKSTFFRMLSKGWFSDSFKLTDMKDKTGSEKINSSWIIEIPELQGMRKTSIETIKAFISQRSDIYRPAWGRGVTKYDRQSVFVGTTNAETGYLLDTTGNSRFWPINTPTRLVDYIDVDQLWSEVMDIWYDKEPLYFEDEEVKAHALKCQNDQLEVNDEYSIIDDYINMEVPNNWYELDITGRKMFLKSSKEEKKKALKIGSFIRNSFSVLEIWIELFDGTLKELGYERSRSILAAIKRLGFNISRRRNDEAYSRRLRVWEKEFC